MAEPVTLPVYCAHCGGAVTLQMSDWPAVVNHDGTPVREDHPMLITGTWSCPWCEKVNQGGFPGKVAWATKGHAESKPV